MKYSLGLVALLGLSCGSKDKPPVVWPLDEVLAVGEARAGKVRATSELIGGPVAYGRVGEVWKLYNNKARFLVQDVGSAVGLDLYGGNLIDADLVHPGDDGSNGHDLFRETFPIVGLHGVKPRTIEVVSDGKSGGAAILRVRGTDAPSDILPQLDDLAQDLGGEITIDYELAPDVPYLKITTTYQASPGQSLTTVGLGDFLSFGASLAVLSPENGFTGDLKAVTFLAGVGDLVSYGYVYPAGEKLSVPLVDASGTAALLSSPPVPTNGSVSVVRYLVIGNGDAASVTGPMYKLRGVTTAPLTGTVRDGAGAPLAGARVTLFRAPYSVSSNCVDQAKTGSDGGYRFDLAPGDYVALTGGIGRVRGAPTPVTLASAGTKSDLVAGATATVSLDIGEVVGGLRVSAPAKVSLVATDVEAPDPRFGPDATENERFGLHAVALSPDGKGKLQVKPGTYRAVISRGVEYELTVVDPLPIGPGEMVTLQADLRRVVDTTGWLAGDYHQHTQGSIDSPVPVGERVAEDLAEGIEFPAATDHDNITDFQPYIVSFGAERWMGAVPGNEISVNGVGHFNAYPMTVDEADPYAKVGAKYWARLTIRELVAKVHTEPRPVVFHVSHPRTKSLAGWFNAVKLDPTTGKAVKDFPLEGFEAVEVNGDLGQPSDFLPSSDAAIHAAATQNVPSGVPTMRDWFSFLNQGLVLCALGNSDTHARNDGTGYPRSFVWFGSDDPSKATAAGLVTAIKAQKVVVSNGPFVSVTVNGEARMGKGEPVSLGGVTTATLGIKVQAPGWVDVTSVEVYANGRPLALRRNGPNLLEQRPDGESGAEIQTALIPEDASMVGGGVVRLDAKVMITPAKDSWYVVVARGKKSMNPVAGGSPYGYTNPIYVDVAGDGWSAPGL